MDKCPKTSAIISTPPPVTSHAIVTPKGLACWASVLGSIKMPDPTIFPTTKAVNNQKPHFLSVPFPYLRYIHFGPDPAVSSLIYLWSNDLYSLCSSWVTFLTAYPYLRYSEHKKAWTTVHAFQNIHLDLRIALHASKTWQSCIYSMQTQHKESWSSLYTSALMPFSHDLRFHLSHEWLIIRATSTSLRHSVRISIHFYYTKVIKHSHICQREKHRKRQRIISLPITCLLIVVFLLLYSFLKRIAC